MSDPYVGEIRMFGGNFAPYGWMSCEGQLLQIAEYDVLFTLVGTTYGGDGVNTFALPDLRGRIPVHQGTLPGNKTFVLGELAGTETATLTTQQLPAHTHIVSASSAPGTAASPGNAFSAAWPDAPYQQGSAPLVALAADSVSPAGGNQAHDNMPPFTALMFIIAVWGTYPSQS